jgi:hypothetical protein
VEARGELTALGFFGGQGDFPSCPDLVGVCNPSATLLEYFAPRNERWNKRQRSRLSRKDASVLKSRAAGRHMIASETPEERRRERRHKVARRLYEALVAQDPDRLIILRDGSGKVVARHDLLAEQDDLEIASRRAT